MVEKCSDECATAVVIKAAFTKTGVYELNQNVFNEDDFLAAKLIAEAESRAENAEEEPMNERVLLVMEEDIPFGSFEEVAKTSGTASLFENLNPSDPIKIGQIGKKSNRGRKAMKSAILNSPQMRSQLKEAAEKRATKRKNEQKAHQNKRIKGKKLKAPPAKKGAGIKKAPVANATPAIPHII